MRRPGTINIQHTILLLLLLPSYEAAKSACHLRAADHLLKLCCANGGVFVKVGDMILTRGDVSCYYAGVQVGQHIGALDYLLPEEYVDTMKVLHNRSPQMPLEDIYSVLREELGKEVYRNMLCF